MATITFQKLFDSSTETQIITGDVNPGGTGLTITKIPDVGYMNILVLANASDSSNAASAINTRLSALGYITGRDYNVTAITLGSSYTGNGDITTPTYNIVVIITNGGGIQGSSTFGTNLNTYVTNGYHLILMTFCWNLRVDAGSIFSYANNNPLTFSGNQSNDGTDVTLSQSVSHPILTNGGISLNVGSTQYNGSVTLTSDSTTLATYPSTGTIGIAIREKGTARLVALNYYPSNLTTGTPTQQNRRNILVNSILWCASRI